MLLSGVTTHCRCGGPALADFAYESFVQAAITRLEEIRLSAVELRIDADLALGRHDELVGEIEALVTEYALDSYNRFRPHRALDGLTPLQRVNNLSGTNT